MRGFLILNFIFMTAGRGLNGPGENIGTRGSRSFLKPHSVNQYILERSGLTREEVRRAVSTGYTDTVGARIDDSYNF